MLAKLMDYTDRFYAKALELVQTKKIAYMLTVVVGNACLIIDILIEKEMSATWVAALTVLTGFCTTGYLGAKHIATRGTNAELPKG